MNDIIYAGKHAITKAVSRHAHTDWEIIYCTGGVGTLGFSDRDLHYHAGDIIVIPPMMPHTNLSDEGFTNIYMNLASCSLANAEPMVISNPKNDNMAGVFSSAFYFYSSEGLSDPALLSAFGNLIVTYVSLYHPGAEKTKLVQQIENHIIHSFSDCNFDLGDYLHSLPFSYDYLIKMFKKDLGVTPHRYLTDLRLRSAADWLKNSQGNNISEIAHISGFKEPLYFSRLFKKKYGVSPSFYVENLPDLPADGDALKIPFPPEPDQD